MAELQIPVRRGLTDEDLALLAHRELEQDSRELEHHEEHGSPAPAGFRDRLVLGDLSW